LAPSIRIVEEGTFTALPSRDTLFIIFLFFLFFITIPLFTEKVKRGVNEARDWLK